MAHFVKAENRTLIVQGRVDGAWKIVNPLRLEPGDAVRLLAPDGAAMATELGEIVFQVVDANLMTFRSLVSEAAGST